MKKGFAVLIVALALVSWPLANGAGAEEGEPRDSGFVLVLVPQFHLADFQNRVDWEDKIDTDSGSLTLSQDDAELEIDESVGFQLNMMYVTHSPLFFGVELGHHVYLGRTKEDLSVEGDSSAPGAKDPESLLGKVTRGEEEEFRPEFDIRTTQFGAFAGIYALPVPFRPYIQAGVGILFETLEVFGEKLRATPFYASGGAGVDFYPHENLLLGAGARADFIFGESFEGKFSKGDSDHDLEVTMDRIPFLAYARLGYMF